MSDSSNFQTNVKEHAPPQAGAHSETGAEVQATQDSTDRAAGGGCVARLFRLLDKWRDGAAWLERLHGRLDPYNAYTADAIRACHAELEEIILPNAKGDSRSPDGERGSETAPLNDGGKPEQEVG